MKKKIFVGSSFLLFCVLLGLKSQACDFHFRIENEKTTYQVGDEIIVTVSVLLTHRVCEVELEDTQFSSKGLMITGATKWVQLSDKIFARKFKIKIIDKNSSAIFSAIRKCQKDGGYGNLTLKVS